MSSPIPHTSAPAADPSLRELLDQRDELLVSLKEMVGFAAAVMVTAQDSRDDGGRQRLLRALKEAGVVPGVCARADAVILRIESR